MVEVKFSDFGWETGESDDIARRQGICRTDAGAGHNIARTLASMRDQREGIGGIVTTDDD